MIADVKMQTIKRRTGRSLTGDPPLFLALRHYYIPTKNVSKMSCDSTVYSVVPIFCQLSFLPPFFLQTLFLPIRYFLCALIVFYQSIMKYCM